MIKMTEMMASYIPTFKKTPKDLENSLKKALGGTIAEGGGLFNEPGRSFFISRSIGYEQSIDMNYLLIRSIAKFNEHAASHLQIKLDLAGFRTFFFGKVIQSTDLSQVYTAMGALKEISSAEAPFLRVVSNDVILVDQLDSLKLQFYDMVSTPINFARELKSVTLVSDAGKDISIDATSASKLSQSEGQLTIDLKAITELVPGSFWVQVRVAKQAA